RAAERPLQVDVPTPIAAVSRPGDPDREPVAATRERERVDLPFLVADDPLAARSAACEAKAAVFLTLLPGWSRRHLPTRAPREPRQQQLAVVAHYDLRPRRPYPAVQNLLQDDRLARREDHDGAASITPCPK